MSQQRTPRRDAAPAQAAVELQIGGMTCASCAARIEKKLNRMPGVSATVNYATENAHVELPERHTVEAAIATVEATGYTARLPRRPGRGRRDRSARDATRQRRARGRRGRSLRQRLLISAVLTVPVLVLAMVPALQFDNWQWLSLTLAAPVVVWGAWPFHRAACDEPPPRRRDDGHPDLARRARRVRLVAVGAVLRRRRHAGHADALRPACPSRRRRRRRSTSRSPPRSPCSSWPAATSRPGPSGGPARRCGRCWSWAPRTSRCSRDGRRAAHPGRPARGRRPVRGAARGEDRHRRRGRRGHLGGGRQPADRRTGAGRGRPRRRGGRRHGQRRRPAGRAGHPGRRRHPAGPDGPAGRAGPDRQGAGAAAGRPGLGGVRARSCIALALATLGRAGWPPGPARRRRSPPRSPC